MKNLTKYFFAAIAILNFNFIVAQKAPAGGTPKDFKLPGKTNKSFPNGFHTTMVQFGDIPKATVQLIIKTGNVHEGPNETWLADLTGRMIKQGSTHFDFKTLSNKVALMGGDLDVSVSTTHIYITGNVLSEFVPDFIKLVADMLINPAFPPSELERLKSDLKRELAVARSVPQSLAQEKFAQLIYKDHPYSRYYPTEEMINSYTLEKVKDFYQKNFGAKRSVLYVAGKFDEAAATAAAAEGFSKWKTGPDVSYPAVNFSVAKDTAIIDRKTAPQTTIMLGLPVLRPGDKDYIPQLVTNSLLGGSFGSRITNNIREDKGYTYSPFSDVQNLPGSSIWVEQADVTSEHTIDALNEIQKEIKRLQDEPPSAAEIQGIQKYEAGIFVLRNSAPGAIISQLAFLDDYHLPDSYLSNYVKEVYKVTGEKVSQVAKENLVYPKMTLVMVGDRDSIQQQMRQSMQKKAF